MNNLYVLSHPTSFLSSEYGGLWVVAASSKEAAADLIVKDLDDDISDYTGFIGTEEERKNDREILHLENRLKRYLVLTAKVAGFTKSDENAIIDRFIT